MRTARVRATRTITAGLVLAALGCALLAAAFAGSPPAHAETGQKALVLASSVSVGTTSLEAMRAAANGFSVTVVSDAAWGAMTAAQFADYQLLIVGDPNCGGLSQVVSTNAQALADAVMARAGGNAKAGNRVLIGTDPALHSAAGGDRLIETAIDFAGVQDGATGLYLDFSCADPDWDFNGTPDGLEHLLPLLTSDPTPGWTQNPFAPCGGDVSLISNAAQFATLTSASLAGWGCSVHETFPTFPIDWVPLAVATDTATTPTCGTDVDTLATRCGEAYVLIAGSAIDADPPDLDLDPPTATNPVGTTHTVTAKVTNPDGTPRGGVVVSFLVTGANAGAAGTCVPASCTSNAAGETTFTYTGTHVGDDTINAAIVVDGSGQTATAAKKWVAPTVKINVSDVSVKEGNTGLSPATSAVFTLALDVASPTPVTASYVTADAGTGTAKATAPADYTAATGSVTFAPGQTSKPVTVAVVGDLLDEPDHTFTLTLTASSATIVDGQGLATILDDDRSGAFTCRATGTRLLGTELAVSNAPDAPCKDATKSVLDLPLGTGTLQLGAKAVLTTTDQTPNDLVGTAPAIGDRAESSAETAAVVLVAGGSTVTASAVKSEARARCATPLGGKPVLTGSTSLVNVKVNGSPVVVGSAEVKVNLLLGVLHINSTTTTATGVMQRGIWFENKVLPSSADVVVAEAKAGYSGNPCA